MSCCFWRKQNNWQKFPQEKNIEEIKKQHETETDNAYAARMYVFKKTNDEDRILKEFESSKDMNPNGFWEMLYTCQGVDNNFWIDDVCKIDFELPDNNEIDISHIGPSTANFIDL